MKLRQYQLTRKIFTTIYIFVYDRIQPQRLAFGNFQVAQIRYLQKVTALSYFNSHLLVGDCLSRIGVPQIKRKKLGQKHHHCPQPTRLCDLITTGVQN